MRERCARELAAGHDRQDSTRPTEART
jgi:hypothetical protein